MIVTVTDPRPTLAAKMVDGYLMAAIFALESWAKSAHLVEQRGADVRENGPMAAYGRAVLQREFWQDEADRYERLARLVSEMRP